MTEDADKPRIEGTLHLAEQPASDASETTADTPPAPLGSRFLGMGDRDPRALPIYSGPSDPDLVDAVRASPTPAGELLALQEGTFSMPQVEAFCAQNGLTLAEFDETYRAARQLVPFNSPAFVAALDIEGVKRRIANVQKMLTDGSTDARSAILCKALLAYSALAKARKAGLQPNGHFGATK